MITSIGNFVKVCCKLVEEQQQFSLGCYSNSAKVVVSLNSKRHALRIWLT